MADENLWVITCPNNRPSEHGMRVPRNPDTPMAVVECGTCGRSWAWTELRGAPMGWDCECGYRNSGWQGFPKVCARCNKPFP